MGQMQPRSNSVGEVKSTIKKIENSQSGSGAKIPSSATPNGEDKNKASKNQK
jgi:hypothetical protein